MSRTSSDQFDSQGVLVNGFDYGLQVWVKNYIIQDCGHPDEMSPGCCNSDKYCNLDIRIFPKDDIRRG